MLGIVERIDVGTGGFTGRSRVVSDDIIEQALDAGLGEVAARIDAASLEEPSEGSAGLLGCSALKLSGSIEGLGEIGDLWGEQFELSAEFGVIGEFLAQLGELLPGCVILADLTKLGGLAEGRLNLDDVG